MGRPSVPLWYSSIPRSLIIRTRRQTACGKTGRVVVIVIAATFAAQVNRRGRPPARQPWPCRLVAPQADLEVGLTIPANSRESGFQASYRGKYHRWNWRQVQHELVRREIEHFGNRQRERIFVVPTELSLDTVDGFPENDGCHPGHAGYQQIGDTIYSWIKARLESRSP